MLNLHRARRKGAWRARTERERREGVCGENEEVRGAGWETETERTRDRGTRAEKEGRNGTIKKVRTDIYHFVISSWYVYRLPRFQRRSTLNFISQLKWRIKQVEHACMKNKAGKPLTWSTGEMVLMKKSVKFMINCQSGKKWNCFIKCLRNVDIVPFDFNIFLSKDKSNRCYFLLYRWYIGVREKDLNQGKVSGKWKLKNNGHPADVSHFILICILFTWVLRFIKSDTVNRMNAV